MQSLGTSRGKQRYFRGGLKRLLQIVVYYMEPFNMIIVRMTSYGKTSYLLNMLEKDYKNYFDYIILICPTFKWNRTYQEWKYIKDNDSITV